MVQINFNKSMNLLKKYKIPFAKSGIVKTEEDAVRAAKQIGYPAALKIISPDIIHKSDVGGVVTDIRDEKDLVRAYESMLKSVKKKAPKAKIEEVLTQEMKPGTEVIIGMKRDPHFDAVLMFGLGGVFVEIMKDVAFRIAPIDKKEAEQMIKEIKGYKVLEGARGKKPADINALSNILTKISKLSLDNKNISEIDLNPVIVDEKSAKVVDVRMVEYEKESKKV